ncbi:MAG: hypothetical protein PWQ57_1574 [Desulfovibrionales bacterium]|jgi:hypothetical protein|nr:hypothetical protein [Desulfovibrionales bacterium]
MGASRFCFAACFAALALAVVLAGCEAAPQEPGVVARVNGRPIKLRQLEFKYDLNHMDALSGPVPTVEDLRSEYGEILGGLIVQELVVQALEKRAMSVTSEEAAQAEQEIRADYPNGAFEQVLIEEYIDLDAWRKQLRYRLALKKLFRQVLRPRIKLDYKEAEQYYQDHLSEFQVPERWELFVLTGPDPQEVEAACGMDDPADNRGSLAEKYPGATPRSITIQKDKLPDAWRTALKDAKIGRPSKIISGNGGFECLMLQHVFPARTLDAMEAYPQVESILIDNKLQAAFDQWLGEALSTAHIEVSDQLLEREPAEHSKGSDRSGE